MSMPKDYRHRKINGSILSFSIKTIDLFDNLFIYSHIHNYWQIIFMI